MSWFCLVVEAVRQRGGGRLVDDAQHFEAGDLAGVARGLALRVVEVRRDGDDRFRDRLAEELLGERLDLHQHERGDLFRRVLAVADLHLHVAVRRRRRSGTAGPASRCDDFVRVVLAADEALDGEDGVERIGDRLPFGDLSDQPLAVLGESDDRRRGAAPLAVRDHLRRRHVDDGDAGVRRPEIDSDDFRHGLRLSSRRFRLEVPSPSGPPTATFTMRRPQQTVVEEVALLQDGDDGVRRDGRILLAHHRLVDVRIEVHARLVDRLAGRAAAGRRRAACR